MTMQRPEVTEEQKAIASMQAAEVAVELSKLAGRANRPQYLDVARVLNNQLIVFNAVLNLARSILIQHEGSAIQPGNGPEPGGGE